MKKSKEMEQSQIVKMFNKMGLFCGDDEELAKGFEEQEKQEEDTCK